MRLPFWDPLRGDPRFEKIVASQAPKTIEAANFSDKFCDSLPRCSGSIRCSIRCGMIRASKNSRPRKRRNKSTDFENAIDGRFLKTPHAHALRCLQNPNPLIVEQLNLSEGFMGCSD